MHNPSNVFEFVSVGEIAETTIQLLSFSLNDDWAKSAAKSNTKSGNANSGLEAVEQLIFQQARDYLSNVREGFVLSVRSAEIPDSYQLRYLLDRVLFDWDSLSHELGLEQSSGTSNERDQEQTLASEPFTEGQSAQTDSTATSSSSGSSSEPLDTLEPVRQQLQAFGMAAIAMGALPKLPAEQVTFPRSYGNPPTYADISAPSSPAEMLIRIEELEEMVWQMMSGNPGQLVQSKYGQVRRTYGFFESSAWLVRNDAERFGIKQNQSAGFTYF